MGCMEQKQKLEGDKRNQIQHEVIDEEYEARWNVLEARWAINDLKTLAEGLSFYCKDVANECFSIRFPNSYEYLEACKKFDSLVGQVPQTKRESIKNWEHMNITTVTCCKQVSFRNIIKKLRLFLVNKPFYYKIFYLAGSCHNFLSLSFVYTR